MEETTCLTSLPSPKSANAVTAEQQSPSEEIPHTSSSTRPSFHTSDDLLLSVTAEISSEESPVSENAIIDLELLNPDSEQERQPSRLNQLDKTLHNDVNPKKQLVQTSIDGLISSPQLDKDRLESLNYIADRIYSRMAKASKSPTLPMSNEATVPVADVSRASSSCKNLANFLSAEQDFELVGENDSWIIRCKLCFLYLNNPFASASLPCKPTGNSLATGLRVNEESYSRYIEGSCAEWRRLKSRMITHLSASSQTHHHALLYNRQVKATVNRQKVAIRNQMRTAIGVVQTKCAASHYETRIAELHQAGAEVGDFGHSRILFPQMIQVACHYVDSELRKFLCTDLPNTGLPPHFYCTADKSTNHRVTNQVTMICPVVNGIRKGIPLGMEPVYQTFDSAGGRGDELARGIYADLKKHAGIHGESLLLMQGKVTDGQYINRPYVTAMNQRIFDVLKPMCNDDDYQFLTQARWWECHWDPGHWLDKVFSKFKDLRIVSQLLHRVALFNQVFGFGKMHAVAKVTAKELKLPFRVTSSFAQQRFMSSSYLSLKNLETSYEAYVETFKDHNNEEELRYKLCGSDFIFDLCGMLDLLWLLTILMLKAQQQWCPGWKFPVYVKSVVGQIRQFSVEVLKEVPSKQVSPHLHKHGKDIAAFKFGKSTLELGWMLQKTKQNNENQPEIFEWTAREVNDCRDDLRDLAIKLIEELDNRFGTSYPELNHLLHKCLDFGIIFNSLCGVRDTQEAVPVNKVALAKVGAKEFAECISFVSRLPHVSALNLPMCEELSCSIFLRLKETLVETVWDKHFTSLFPKFFNEFDEKDQILKEIKISPEVFATSFERVLGNGREFTLTEMYTLELSDDCVCRVVLQEDQLIDALYNNPEFYSQVG